MSVLATAERERDRAVRDRVVVGLPERQNIEAELARLAAIVASSNDAIISTGLDGIVATWNAAAEAIFGYRPDEVIGRPVSMLATPGRENEMPLMLDRIKRGERIEHYDTVRRDKHGKDVDVSLTVSPVRDANGWIVGASKIARDITERKRTNAELLHLTETLERRVAERTAELEGANRRLRAEIAERADSDARLRELESELFHAARLSAVGQMAGALAHELNQPLAAAANFVNAARRLLASGQRARVDRVPEVLGEAAAEVLRAGHIIRRLRDFVRRGASERQPESIAAIIEEASALALAGAGTVGIKARFRLDPNAVYALANRVEIQQVLINLMRNAIEAMAESVRRELEVTTTLLDDETIEITVGDSGPGLAKEVARRLFEPFVSTKPDGMGLGLSICRSMVQANGGRLKYEPNSGGGTIFRFTLRPFRGGTRMMDPDAERTVYVVDDDPAILRSLERLLDAAGFACVAYASAPGFLEAAPELSAGCVLLDIRMPEADGIEVQARLNRLGVPLSVIMMTGHGDIMTAVRAMKGGAIDVIEKPFDDELLIAAIETALARSSRASRDREIAEAAERIATLSRRERQVLDGLVAGQQSKIIAHSLGISVRTVEVHRARMLERLGTRRIAGAIRLAVLAALAPDTDRTADRLASTGGRSSPHEEQSRV